jgi:hypothetical protein
MQCTRAEKIAGSNDRESNIMNISSAELLAAVAIVTSAGVFQIRQHMEPHAGVTASTPDNVRTAPSSCGTSGNGIIPASCEPAREQPPTEHAVPLPQRGTARIWV